MRLRLAEFSVRSSPVTSSGMGQVFISPDSEVQVYMFWPQSTMYITPSYQAKLLT